MVHGLATDQGPELPPPPPEPGGRRARILAAAALQPALSLSSFWRMHMNMSRPSRPGQSLALSAAQAFFMASRAAAISGEGVTPPPPPPEPPPEPPPKLPPAGAPPPAGAAALAGAP